jgi:uncharacterized membrane protein YbhN (UPF0104 family)
MTSATGRFPRLALACALGLTLLAWMARGVEWPRLAASLRPAPWWSWVAAVLGLAGSYGLRALRIHAELRPYGGVTVGQCLRVMLVHNAAVNVLPMRGGEAAYPWLVHRRLGVPVAHAVASLVWMRAQDALVLVLLVVALWPGIAPAARVLTAGGVAAAMLGSLALLQRAGARPELARSPLKLIRAAHTAVDALARARRHGIAGWAYCAGSWSLKLVALGVLLAALSGIDPAAALGAALGGELAGVLPVQGPAGLGTYEGGVWAGASVRGLSAADVAAPALAVHLLSLFTALAAGAVAHGTSGRRTHVTSTPSAAT